MDTKFFKGNCLVIPQFKDLKVSYYFQDSRYGFNHVAEMTAIDENGYNIYRRNKVHYINRTWESYPGKTAMMGVLYSFATELVDQIALEYKQLTRRKRLPAKMKEDTLRQVLDGDNAIGVEYRKLKTRGYGF